MTTTQQINAGENPDLANSLINQALAETEPTVAPATIIPPFDNSVVLPSGYIGSDGKLHSTAEVRELNGMDEEAMSKVDTLIRLWSTILSRGVVNIGGIPVTEEMLDKLLIGDRDALVLAVYKATFGNVSKIEAFCTGCKEYKTVLFDLTSDIKTKKLLDPIKDRTFEVYGKKSKYLVTLPTGATQKDMSSDPNKTDAELKTSILEHCVLEIDDQPLMTKMQIKAIGIQDRTLLVDQIAERNPGPQFENFTIDCPDCGGKVVVPVTLGTIFRY